MVVPSKASPSSYFVEPYLLKKFKLILTATLTVGLLEAFHVIFL